MTEEELNSYRLTSLEEPSVEMLGTIMKEAAEDVKKENAETHRRFMEQLREDVRKDKERWKDVPIVFGSVEYVETDKDIDSYRLTDLEEPTDEMLAAIMHEAAEDVRKENERINKWLMEQIWEEACKAKQRWGIE